MDAGISQSEVSRICAALDVERGRLPGLDQRFDNQPISDTPVVGLDRQGTHPKQPDQQRSEGGRWGSDLRIGRAATEFTTEATLDFSRPAETRQPNGPSCGNQPAKIHLTAPVA